MTSPQVPPDCREVVARALAEDVGSGDLTARLVAEQAVARARIIAREPGVACGAPWVHEVFAQLDPRVRIDFLVGEGEALAPEAVLCELAGPARALLTGERTALNFLQMLSGTASLVRAYVDAVAGTGARIVDTRKTVPGLRLAQKYAVRCGGGINHRIGLYDGILIKENHVAAAGGIRGAIEAARALGAGVPLMSEAEDLDEVRAALDAGVDLLLLDDFPLPLLREAVALARSRRASGGGGPQLEASGGITLETVREVALTGVDRISIGGLTKNVRTIDLSMRFHD